MKLITELNEEVRYLEEATEDGKKNLFIEGIFLQAAVKNRNGRIYPESVMDKEVNRYIKESVNSKRALGELGHPDGPQINLDRVSHIVTELRKEGTNWIGKAKITETPMGNIARGLIESGAQLGVSSRGMGTLKPVNGINEVQDDFRLCCAADIVSDPSGPNCFVNGIMEGVEFWYDDKLGLIKQDIAEQAKKEIEEATRAKELDQRKFKIFEQYMRKLSKIQKK